LLQDRTDGEAVKLRRHERVAILAGGLVAAIERVIRSAQNVAASAATFARNDLLFTMSDNTRVTNVPWTGRLARRGFVFGRTARFVLGRNFSVIDRRDRRWWSQTGSNRRPPACKAGALPTELWPRAGDQQNLGTQHKRDWWAWEDLNFRPHAYQARALTN
jgi:hypothetical protein